ncbi:MAG: S-layer homology domain-containing protein [Clostridia bacterium]|nr:S-layer homology domain-containing protein [Clostridia bacterium]
MKKTTLLKRIITCVLSMMSFVSLMESSMVLAEDNIIAAWEGKNPEEYTWSNGNWTTAVCEYKEDAGTAAIKFPSSKNPSAFFSLASPVTQADKITKMVVGMKTNQDVCLKLYYVTGTKFSGFKEGMSTNLLSFEKGDGDFREYEFPVNSGSFKGFKDDIQAFRVTVSQSAASPVIDFEKGLEVEFKYIRFAGGNEEIKPDEPAEEWPVVQPEEAGFEGRTVIYGVEMNNSSIFNDWGQGIKKYPPDINDGVAEFEITNKTNMAYAKEATVKIQRNKIAKVAMKLRSTAQITPQVYFSGTGEAIDSTRMLALPIVAASDEFKVVSADTSSNELWGAVPDLTRYRLSFSGANDGDKVEVDWVRFYSDVIPSFTEDEKCITYDFEGTEYGFESIGNVSDAVVYDGKLWARVTGDGDGFYRSLQPNVSAEDIKRIDIAYKNESPGSKGKLYFTTDACEEYCEECCFTFDILSNESGVYKIDTQSNKNWTGKITGLKFIPSDEAGNVIIDYIQLNKLSCSVKSRSGKVKAVGNLYGIAGEEVSVFVRNASETVLTQKTQTNEKGEFTFEFVIPEAPAQPSVYNAFFTSNAFDGEYMVQFVNITKQYTDNVFAEINKAKDSSDAQKLKVLIETDYDILDIQSAFYDEFTSKGLYTDDMYNLLVQEIDAFTAENIGKKIDNAIALASMKYMSGEEWFAAIDKYDDYLKFKEHSEYDLYKEADEAVKKEIANKIGTHTEYESARRAFDEQTVLARLKYAVTGGEVKHILEHISKENISIDLTEADELKNPEGAYSLLTEGSYRSFEDVKTAFENAVKHQKQKEKKTTGGSSGGSGGGGGNNINYYSDIAKAPVTNATPSTPAPSTTNADKMTAFSDMNGYEWASEAVNELYRRKIISGTEDGIFEPSRQVTREEFVKMLVSMFELPLSEAVYFTDAEKGSWYAPYIAAAAENGFVNGQGDIFGVGQPLTRQDAAVMVNRILGYESKAGETLFTDNDIISDYAKGAIFNLNQKGIINGYGDGSFAPINNLSRAEAAVMLGKLI